MCAYLDWRWIWISYDSIIILLKLQMVAFVKITVARRDSAKSYSPLNNTLYRIKDTSNNKIRKVGVLYLV